jgi:hypothetical protein
MKFIENPNIWTIFSKKWTGDEQHHHAQLGGSATSQPPFTDAIAILKCRKSLSSNIAELSLFRWVSIFEELIYQSTFQQYRFWPSFLNQSIDNIIKFSQ